jgi:hypothetical protein
MYDLTMTAQDFQNIVNSPWTITIVGGLIVGIVVAVVVYFIYKSLDRRQKDLQTKVQNQNEKAERVEVEAEVKLAKTSVTPSKTSVDSTGYELVQKINELAPYLREEAENAYVGQHIKLDVKFRDLGKVPDSPETVRLYMVSKEGFPWVYGSVRLQDFPWLKTLRQDALVTVEGIITKFHGHDIELKEISLAKK